MKNILLVMPRITYAINDWNIPPVGIAYVSASMKKMGLPIYNINLNLEEGKIEDIIKKAIIKHKIEIVCTGDLVVNYSAVKDIVDTVKGIDKSIITIIGGGLVTHSPIEAMDIIKNADYGVIGEGEITDIELVQAINNQTDLSQVKGIIYRENEKLHITDSRADSVDIDSIPWPDYEGFNYFELLKRHLVEEKLTAPLTTSRSCPFRCTFCSKSGGSKYRQRSLDSIFEEMDYLITKYNVVEFFLNDELFADKLERVEAFCKRVKERNVNWHVMLRISSKITEELLRMMKNSGCVGICYGLESADDKILCSMKKGINVKMMLQVLKLTKAEGINVRGGFIFGDTLETVKSADYTLNWILENIELINNVSISPIVLYPGSALYERAVRERKIKSTKEHILQGCPLVNISEMSDNEYYHLVNVKLPQFTAKFRKKISYNIANELNETIINYNCNKHYIHEFTCRKCNSRIRNRLYTTDMFQKHMSCPNCGEKYDFFPNFLYFNTFNRRITEILSDSQTAIWGAGETLNCLYECNKYLRENDVVIIDSNLHKQQQGFYDKKVYSPEALKEKSIEKIICCVGNVFYNQLKNMIPKQYPEVKKVIWINEVILCVEED